MRAFQVTRPGTARLVDLPEPVPGRGEALVAVAACGICGTDLHILAGEFPPTPYPIVPGHEAAGTVVALGADATRISVGDRVAIDPSLFCGSCRFCRMGRGNLCESWGAVGDTCDGAFAEYVSVPAGNLYPIPSSMEFAAAALIEPVSCAVHAMDRLPAVFGADVLVSGAGTMGLIVAGLLRAAGASRVALCDINEARLERAGAVGHSDVATSIATLSGGQPTFDIAVDATGVPTVIGEALGAVRRGGTMMIFGVAPAGSTVLIEPFRIYNDEITVIGSMAVLASYGRAVRLVADGVIDAAALISHSVGLADIEEGFDLTRRGAGLKVQVCPSR